mmetsp:Transcript_26219/g.75725  ORF Transcript_26219/g.75725 Transcript_26219/m.75725 type:complete len:240 (+) Transcript_26219:56-775(+)
MSRLDLRISKRGVECLNRQQLDGSRGCEPRPNRHETTPQARDSALRDGLCKTVHKSVIQLRIRRLVHQLRPYVVERAHSDRHSETGHNRRTEHRPHVLPLPSRRLSHGTFRHIITTHLGGVQDASAANVGAKTAVKAAHALVTVHVSHQRSQRDRFALVRLGKSLHDIEGVSDDRTNTASNGTGQELDQKCGYVFFERTHGITDGGIGTELDRGVRALTAPGEGNSLPKAGNSFSLGRA